MLAPAVRGLPLSGVAAVALAGMSVPASACITPRQKVALRMPPPDSASAQLRSPSCVRGAMPSWRRRCAMRAASSP
ncbi:hypothetical protein CUTA107171_24175 [Cupriavidus taiwanensis]